MEHLSPVAHRFPRNPTPLRKHTIRIPYRPRLPFPVLPTNGCNGALPDPNANATVGQASTNVILSSSQAGRQCLAKIQNEGIAKTLAPTSVVHPSAHLPTPDCGRFYGCAYVCETRSKRDGDLGCPLLGPAWLRGVSYRGVGLGIDLDGEDIVMEEVTMTPAFCSPYGF